MGLGDVHRSIWTRMRSNAHAGGLTDNEGIRMTGIEAETYIAARQELVEADFVIKVGIRRTETGEEQIWRAVKK